MTALQAQVLLEDKHYENDIYTMFSLSYSAQSAERSYMENNRNTPAFSLNRRIGSTSFKVNAYTSGRSAETIEDKILRLVRNEVLDSGERYAIMNTPQMSRQSERSAS